MTLRIGILTVSDRVSAGAMQDEGGTAIGASLRGTGWTIEQEAVVPDDLGRIAETLKRWSDDLGLDVILSTGGTGLGPRDVTPEATLSIADRVVPGIAEAIRLASLQQTQMAMLSRGAAVVRGHTLVINLPGSPRGAAEGAAVVLPVLAHAIATLRGGKH
jgi:molybdenum cofactor synthesis domain-containing protein